MKKRLFSLFTSLIMVISLVAVMPAVTKIKANAISDAGGNFSSATKIEVNKLYSDNISYDNDLDYFRFILPYDGVVSISFNHKNLYEEHAYWNADVYDSCSKKIDNYAFLGNKEKTVTHKLGLSAGTYFLKVEGSYYVNLWNNHGVYDDSIYTFSVNYTSSSLWEKENNNSFDDSNEIIIGKSVYGNLKDVWDCDYFSFEVDSTDVYRLSFGHGVINNNADSEYYEIRIYDKYGTEKYYLSSKGRDESLNNDIILNKGKFFVRIGGGYSYGGHLCSQKYSDGDYNLKVTLKHKYNNTVKKPTYDTQGYTLHKCSVCGASYKDNYKAKLVLGKVSKLKASSNKTNSVKLSWNKVSGATGYYVYQQKNGKWSKIKTTKSTSYTVPKLKSGTTYKFAIKAYKTSNSSTITSASYSTVTTSTKPATVNFKLTAGSKKATVKWNKVTGATGYKVYYKTSKKGSWKLLKTTGSGTTSYTKTGLTKGKTYYFTVKAVRTTGGKTYNGSYTAKSVKVK